MAEAISQPQPKMPLVLEIRDQGGAVVVRPHPKWGTSVDGAKWWSGLARGDHVYANGTLVFIADDPA